MDIDKELRDGVIQALPEAEQIKDKELKEKVYNAWALSLATSGYRKIEDIPASGNPDTPLMKTGTQADHLRSVARLAVAMAKDLAGIPEEEKVSLLHYPKKKGLLSLFFGGGSDSQSIIHWALYRFVQDDLIATLKLLEDKPFYIMDDITFE